jgi:hypothetical protein
MVTISRKEFRPKVFPGEITEPSLVSLFLSVPLGSDLRTLHLYLCHERLAIVLPTPFAFG